MANTAPTTSQPALALRAARIEQGLTLRELAARIGMPFSTLSKLENGKMALTYDKLMRLALGLGVDVGALLSAPSAADEPHPSTGRRAVTRAGGAVSVDYEHRHFYPAADLLGKMMEPVLIEVRARSVAELGGLVRHAGEEYLYVLAGSMELHSELYAPLVLNVGDSIYFDSGMAHAYVRTSPEPCRVLTVMAGTGIRTFAEAARQQLRALGGKDPDPGADVSVIETSS